MAKLKSWRPRRGGLRINGWFSRIINTLIESAMDRVHLPPLFAEILRNSEFEAPVADAIAKCSEFFGDPTRGLTFFPEYSEHGVAHVQRVVDAAAALIDPAAISLVTATDIAVLTVAVLIHDSAMHITEDGFLALTDSAEDPLVPELDQDCWSLTWQKYFAEASHWDERQLHRVIGDVADPTEDLAKWIRPVEDMGSPEKWSTRYRKFIGEFIRRNHARLAHEFSLAGAPGPSGKGAFELNSLSSDLANLAGLIARSHNMSLRDTFSYLQTRFFGRAVCLGTHPVFMMILLRIADYLQIESDRTPSSSLRVRTLRNPISRGEWESHLSIREVRQDEQDAEAIFVVARPSNANTFLKVRSLLDGFQSELDTSWAVLGEVYSRQGDLAALGIRLRRVRSNLDDIGQLRKSIEYVPARFAFDTAGAALLKKLVVPLYGDRPEVGIRELLQNAVDAVNELSGFSGVSGPTENAASIRVCIENNSTEGHWITVEDFGIGMDETTLRSYFFRAGASFRESDAWRRTFCPDGTPTVIRSGRFGIGVLAAFLLGDHIEVTTRHVSAGENEALTFAASIEDEVVEVRMCERSHSGTTIRVRIGGATYNRLIHERGLEWDWFRWNEPKVARRINDDSELPRLTRIPGTGGRLPDTWHRLAVEGYEEVLWTFGRAPQLVCNGVNIGVSASSQGYSRHMNWEGEARSHDLSIGVAVPCVAVTDRRGVFPIDLQRFSLIAHRYPFANELMADVTRDFVAFSLVFAPDRPHTGRFSSPPQMFFNYPGRKDQVSASFHFPSQWFFTNEGSGVLHWASLRQTQFTTAKLLLLFDFNVPFPDLPVEENEALFVGHLDLRSFPHSTIPMALSHMLGRSVRDIGPHLSFFTKNEDVTMFLPSNVAQMFANLHGGQIDLRGLHQSELNFKDPSGQVKRVAVWKERRPSAETQLGVPLNVVAGVTEGLCLYAHIEKPRLQFERENAFTDTWQSLMPDPIIPFDRDARRKRFSATFEALKDFIAKWESLREMGAAKLKRHFQRTTEEGYNERF